MSTLHGSQIQAGTIANDRLAVPYTDEQVRDVIGAALVAGSNITITPNDGADTITIASTGGYTDEQVRDVIGAALVAGSGVTITVNDAGDTITLASSGGGSTSFADLMAADKPIAYWPLSDAGSPYEDNSSIFDAVKTGTVAAGASLVTGLSQSLDFASSPILTAPDAGAFSPLSFGTKQMTLECVVKFPSLPGSTAWLLNKAASAGGSNYEWGFGLNSTGTVSGNVWGTGGAGNLGGTTTGTLATNTTKHIAMVVDYDNRIFRIYFNGVLQTLTSTTDNIGAGYGAGNSTVVIGKRGDGSGANYTGLMAAAAVHDRALSSKRLLARVPFLV